MAVVKANFVKRGKTAKARAKATIRYLLHRPGKEGTRTTRTLFGADGVMSKQQAYRMIDAAKNGTTFFRLVISPDPVREDRGRDLHLPEITSHTLLQLEERLKKPVHFIAAEHDDHSPNRHVHALVLVQGRLTREDVQALRLAATNLARFQRLKRDLALGQQSRGPVIPVPSPSAERTPQAKPVVDLFTCFVCGTAQWVAQRQAYRCGTCGARLSRDGRTKAEKGLQWAA